MFVNLSHWSQWFLWCSLLMNKLCVSSHTLWSFKKFLTNIAIIDPAICFGSVCFLDFCRGCVILPHWSQWCSWIECFILSQWCSLLTHILCVCSQTYLSFKKFLTNHAWYIYQIYSLSYSSTCFDSVWFLIFAKKFFLSHWLQWCSVLQAWTFLKSFQFRWYEGANPFGPGHNQSIEGINRSIKENQTFRLKLPMGELFTVTLRLVSEHSKVTGWCIDKVLTLFHLHRSLMMFSTNPGVML